MRHYYGIDLRELFSEDRPLSPRFVLIHVKNLPIDSAFYAELRGGQEFRGWDEGRYMDAATNNAIRMLLFAFVCANIDPKKSRKPNPPEPWKLPGKQSKAERQEKPGSFGFMAKSMLAAKKKKREGGG